MKIPFTLITRTAAGLVVACMTVQPVFAAQTDISSVPLGSAAGATYMPNLLFILDDSGSMGNEFNPDYVGGDNSCLTDSNGNNNCQRGDPPFEAGGVNGFNGVGYDPNFTYLPGLTANGQPVVNPPSGTLTTTSVTKDAYLGGGTTNVQTSVTDKRFCNATGTTPAPVCKRNGASDATSAVLPSGGTDASGHTFGVGQFPYRTHASNSSTQIFGLPEMMPIGNFSRASNVVTVTTLEAHNLAANDRIFVTGTGSVDSTLLTVASVPTTTSFTFASTGGNMPSGVTASFTRPNNSNTVTVTSANHGMANNAIITVVSIADSRLDVTNVPVTVTNGSTFTYQSTSAQAQITATSGVWTRPISYRKQSTGSWARASGTVTVTATNHGMVVGDIIQANPNTGASFSTATFTVTAVATNSFSYSSNNGTGTVAGFWVRSGLYNIASTVNSPAYALRITPIEFCTDANLTSCLEFLPGANPGPAKDSVPAYVRFCKTLADALSPVLVTGTSGTPATDRCQAKFVNQSGLQPYIYPRFGWFNRDTITTGLTFGNRPNRSDCTNLGPPNCIFNEEIQNYAKWYAYYRDRMTMMKTSAGRSFLPFISNTSAVPPKPDRLRVGFITINPTNPNSSNSSSGTNVLAAKYLKIDTFNTANATNWYTKFYSIIPDPRTPLRLALARAGWIFGGKLGTGLTAGIPAADDPLQASCQKNYAFLTTDGFWNQGAGKDLANNDIGNLDNVDNLLVPPYISPNFMVSRSTGTFDGNILGGTVAGLTPGGGGTLADIALYYYQTDLRPAGSTSPSTTPPNQDVSTNNVQAKSGSVDFATHQHMNTYTIGLADGLMRYVADYDDPKNKTSDFNSIKTSAPATGNCYWATGTCDWPSPVADGQSALDDLWHAAVNGRGRFYSAVNPNALATGLSSALNNLNVAVASAAAAATSSPQVSQSGSKAFSTTYQTATWSGEVYAQNIDPQTGVVLSQNLPNDGKVWEAHKKLVTRVNSGTDPRKLLTFDVSATPVVGKLKDFKWPTPIPPGPADPNGALSAAEQAFFSNKCLPLTTMAQCSSLTPTQLLTANDGSQLVGFLQGSAANEGGAFRDRTEIDASGAPVQTILGDIVNSQPVFVRAPFFLYDPSDDPGGGEKLAEPTGAEPYKTFRNNNATRSGPLLIGANDGFLHAFDPSSDPTNGGRELWAYAPRFLLPNMYQLADSGYPGQHRFFVDGTPETADVLDPATLKWRTIVVGGTNSGGRGFYALDVTNPTSPKGLWEFCNSSTLCPNDAVSGMVHSDPDLGFSYGNPIIGRRSSDGKWVVVLTSGLNNITPLVPGPGFTPGSGQGFFYVLDAITGQILHKILADDGSNFGTPTTPSGLMKMGGYFPNGLHDPQFTHVYGGDQLGHVWRVDFTLDPKTFATYPVVTTGSPFVKLLATLKDGAGRIQPLTARPSGTHLGPDSYNPTTRIYYVGTGRYIGNSDLADPGAASGLAWQQSLYGIRDQLDSPRASFDPRQNFRSAGTSFAVEQKLGPSGAADRTITKNPVDWAKQDGFFIDLNPKINDKTNGDSPGERVVLDVRLILGTLIFTSTIPKSGCEPGGDSFQYFLDFRSGGYVGNDATAIAGVHVGSFLVGTAVEQTADDLLKALNKTVGGDNRTAAIPTDARFLGQRFSYRER